ncbi:NAD(P)-binding domain-containing protein [Akkermansiaceae bacterium]|nr:NAD(P)-binding domain-containing protein [Akkermansiaceae bacterium]
MENNVREIVCNRIDDLIALKGSSNKKIVFTVGNTRVLDSSTFYLTPIRFVEDLIISGVVLFSEIEGSIVFDLLNGKVDYIFVDCEKKSKNNRRGYFNLERLSVELITSSDLYFYKGNDVTVDSIDSFIFQYYKSLGKLIGGKKILIVGVGNVGFKIALKLVERGANVFFKSRNISKARSLADTINLIKPLETISSVSVHSKHQKYDAVILCHLKPLRDNNDIINSMDKGSLIIDVGKGCLTNEQIILLNDNDIFSYRLDIGETFINQIKISLSGIRNFNIPRSKKLSVGYSLIEPGIIGKENDVVIDSIKNPKVVYGICDGAGGLITKFDKSQIFKEIRNG